jgi:GNAT superfamily N-acetyltransferase
MSWEEYELMPWKLGWKHEYWDGRAHITPGQHVMCVVMAVKPHAIHSSCRLRRVTVEDHPELTTLFFQAFRDTIEFCDWSRENIRDAATRSIDAFFDGTRGEPHLSSRVVVRVTSRTKREQIIGAALIVEPELERPVLDVLFVSPRARRRGIASALAGAAMNELQRLGIATLESTHLMGNTRSRAWHRKFGFVEEPDLPSAQLYYRHAEHELQRHEKLHHLSESALLEVTRESACWRREAERLEVVAREQGYERVCPILRRADRRRTTGCQRR